MSRESRPSPDTEQTLQSGDEDIKRRHVDSASNNPRSPSSDSSVRYAILPAYFNTAVQKLELKRNIKVTETLGSGRNGTVVKGWDPVHKRNLAIKIQAVRMQEEFTLWKDLRHPNIMPLLETVIVGKQTFAYLMPLMGPTLEEVVAKKEFRESVAVFRDLQRWFWNITNGLSYLHERGLYHGDIKPDNILLTSESVAVLSDFTFLTKNTSAFRNKVGFAKIFRAPELWKTTVQPGCRRRRLLPLDKLDVWALGMTFLDSLDPSKMSTLVPGKQGPVTRRKKRKWRGWDMEIRPYIEQVKGPAYLGPQLKVLFPHANMRTDAFAELFRFILVEPLDDRPPVSEVLKHAFFSVVCSPPPLRPVDCIRTPHRPLKLQNALTICDRYLSYDEEHLPVSEREPPQKRSRSACSSSGPINFDGIFPKRMVCFPRPNFFAPMMCFSSHIVSTLFSRQ